MRIIIDAHIPQGVMVGLRVYISNLAWSAKMISAE